LLVALLGHIDTNIMDVLKQRLYISYSICGLLYLVSLFLISYHEFISAFLIFGIACSVFCVILVSEKFLKVNNLASFINTVHGYAIICISMIVISVVLFFIKEYAGLCFLVLSVPYIIHVRRNYIITFGYFHKNDVKIFDYRSNAENSDDRNKTSRDTYNFEFFFVFFSIAIVGIIIKLFEIDKYFKQYQSTVSIYTIFILYTIISFGINLYLYRLYKNIINSK